MNIKKGCYIFGLVVSLSACFADEVIDPAATRGVFWPNALPETASWRLTLIDLFFGSVEHRISDQWKVGAQFYAPFVFGTNVNSRWAFPVAKNLHFGVYGNFGATAFPFVTEKHALLMMGGGPMLTYGTWKASATLFVQSYGMKLLKGEPDEFEDPWEYVILPGLAGSVTVHPHIKLNAEAIASQASFATENGKNWLFFVNARFFGSKYFGEAGLFLPVVRVASDFYHDFYVGFPLVTVGAVF